MAEDLIISKSDSRKERYESLLPQIEALVSGEGDLIANLANTAAALKEGMGFFWVGFYLVRDEELVLGPFQGPVACTRIQKGKGVCGMAWEKHKTILVPDVDKFPGHITCSNLSKSEIVVPGIENSKMILLLDVDSDKLNDFDKTDEEFLGDVVDLLLK